MQWNEYEFNVEIHHSSLYLFQNRLFLESEETSIDHLEQKLEKALKMCTISVDSGKEYVKNQRYE